ncbi:MAG: hypothetical protein V1717_00145, partial [Candidatus Micrarchaeota archaeon]
SDHLKTEFFNLQSYPLLYLTPSNQKDRTSFLVVLKCKQKTFAGQAFLYMQNCGYLPPATSVHPDSCLNFHFEVESDELTEKCGFT